MSRRHDAGLAAVARVRSVRETDSRIGLQTALGEQRGAQARVDELRVRLDAADTFTAGSAGSFVALRHSLEVLGSVLITAEAERDQASTISEAALARWHQDKSRLAAIEMLLERRADARREEANRLEARDLDDISAQRWLRQEATR